MRRLPGSAHPPWRRRLRFRTMGTGWPMPATFPVVAKFTWIRFPIPEVPSVSRRQGQAAFVQWRTDDRELYFLGPNGRTLLACDVTLGTNATVGVPRSLFELPPDP